MNTHTLRIAPKQFSYLMDLEGRGDNVATDQYAEQIGWPWRATAEQLTSWTIWKGPTGESA